VTDPELRASHEDRDRAAELLRVAAGDGRLTAEELDQRLDRALTARTVGELAELSRDLPAVGEAAAAGQAKDTITIERQGGNDKREGCWLVPRRLVVRIGWGHVTLDFTEAVLTHPVLDIDLDVRSGTLTLLTRPGISIDTDDVAVRSSGSVKIRVPPEPTGPVVLHIVLAGTVNTGHLRARPKRGLRRRRAS
jgi:DUF1707 SHOCT-like domain